MLKNLNDGGTVRFQVFGKEKDLRVFSTGDSQFNAEGDYGEEGFPLNEEELACLNWLLEEVRIEDYRKEITAHCNERYEMIGGRTITEEELEEEVSIDGVAVNISEITQSIYGDVYPEISFVGECECDPELGICIGFRNKRFLGVDTQDWTL